LASERGRARVRPRRSCVECWPAASQVGYLLLWRQVSLPEPSFDWRHLSPVPRSRPAEPTACCRRPRSRVHEAAQLFRLKPVLRRLGYPDAEVEPGFWIPSRGCHARTRLSSSSFAAAEALAAAETSRRRVCSRRVWTGLCLRNACRWNRHRRQGERPRPSQLVAKASAGSHRCSMLVVERSRSVQQSLLLP
jgi:hypothetical protein